MSSLDHAGHLSVRTYAVRSNDFKRDANGRLPTIVRNAYRVISMPKHVWVVEIADRRHRKDGDRSSLCVIGEVVIDPTSPIHEPRVLSAFVHGVFLESGEQPLVVDPDLYSSGIPGAP